jgi:hypothetical protein
LGLLLVIAGLVITTALLWWQTLNKRLWKITGQLEETCSCSPACPCYFNSNPTKMMCSGGEFVFIEKGNYGNLKLDGLAFGNINQSPQGRKMAESYGDWNFSYNYIDEKASPEQRKALQAIANVVLGSGASKKTETRYVAITRRIDGENHEISLGKYGSFIGHLVEGGLSGSTKITNPPGADPVHHEYFQGITSGVTYTDAGQNWSFNHSNYMFGTFTIDDVQYAKLAATAAPEGAGDKKETTGEKK